MAKNEKPTQARLQELLDYDTASGIFKWKVDRTWSVKAGDVAGSPAAGGYVGVSVDWRVYRAHRLAWLYVHGEWPGGPLDHINGDKTDNRLANLRATTPVLNTQNQRKARSDNKCGVMGVRLNCGKWEARIGIGGGRQKYLGVYADQAEAHAVYLEAKRRLHEGCTL